MQAVTIDYTNWKGSRRRRQVVPQTIYFGASEFHPGLQWFLWAIDVEDGKNKSFAMKDIHFWSQDDLGPG